MINQTFLEPTKDQFNLCVSSRWLMVVFSLGWHKYQAHGEAASILPQKVKNAL